MDFKPHSIKQNQAVWSDKPIVVVASGIQWGKTTVGAVKMMMAMFKYTDPKDNFLIVAPTYKIMQQSTLPAFKALMGDFGTFHKGDMVFNMHGGGTAYLRTATDPDSIVGVTNVRMIWGDEAGLYSLYFWENMQARAAFKQAQIVLTTSPYTLNWIYKEIIKLKMKDATARLDVDLFRARSDENPYFPKVYYEEKRKTMDPRRFEMMFGGEWNKFQGLVYDCFHEERDTCEPFAIPSDADIIAGVDWGTTHPFVVHVRAILKNGMQYQIDEHYQTGLTVTGMIDICKRLQKLHGISRWYCDPSQPGSILEFQINGLSAIGADNDIRLGIDRHYGLIKQGRFKMFRGMCPYTLDEMSMYRYPDDDDQAGPNKDVKERNPVKQNEDTMDAMRYVSVHTYRHMELQPTIISDNITGIKRRETRHEHNVRLRTAKKITSEDWS